MTTSVDTKPRAQRVESQAQTTPTSPVATEVLLPLPATATVPTWGRRGLVTRRRVRSS